MIPVKWIAVLLPNAMLFPPFCGGIRVAIEDEQDCSSVLQQIAACRGAINSLLVEILHRYIK